MSETQRMGEDELTNLAALNENGSGRSVAAGRQILAEARRARAAEDALTERVREAAGDLAEAFKRLATKTARLAVLEEALREVEAVNARLARDLVSALDGRWTVAELLRVEEKAEEIGRKLGLPPEEAIPLGKRVHLERARVAVLEEALREIAEQKHTEGEHCCPSAPLDECGCNESPRRIAAAALNGAK